MSVDTSFPVIDISKIDDPKSQLQIAKEITEACKQWGFLLIKGHDIPPPDIQEMFNLGKTFFSLPDDQKDPYPITANSTGYMGSFRDRNKDDKMSMWFGGVPGALLKGPNADALPPFWQGANSVKVTEFKNKCHALVLKLLVCFALAMGLPDRNFFAQAHKDDVEPGNSFRMLMYPARKQGPGADVGSRMAQHTDSGSVTLLFQQQPGLEVLSPADEWVKAPMYDDHILVNLGDALSFWSGGALKATLHRVTFDGLPYDQERQTMAYFGSANPDTVLQPLEAGKRMGKYVANGLEIFPGITAGEYRSMIMRDIYGTGSKGEGKGRSEKERLQAITA